MTADRAKGTPCTHVRAVNRPRGDRRECRPPPPTAVRDLHPPAGLRRAAPPGAWSPLSRVFVRTASTLSSEVASILAHRDRRLLQSLMRAVTRRAPLESKHSRSDAPSAGATAPSAPLIRFAEGAASHVSTSGEPGVRSLFPPPILLYAPTGRHTSGDISCGYLSALLCVNLSFPGRSHVDPGPAQRETPNPARPGREQRLGDPHVCRGATGVHVGPIRDEPGTRPTPDLPRRITGWPI